MCVQIFKGRSQFLTTLRSRILSLGYGETDTSIQGVQLDPYRG
ncbi:hypothetical protein [Coleofasciculus sp. G2-EDA-02]